MAGARELLVEIHVVQNGVSRHLKQPVVCSTNICFPLLQKIEWHPRLYFLVLKEQFCSADDVGNIKQLDVPSRDNVDVLFSEQFKELFNYFFLRRAQNKFAVRDVHLFASNGIVYTTDADTDDVDLLVWIAKIWKATFGLRLNIEVCYLDLGKIIGDFFFVCLQEILSDEISVPVNRSVIEIFVLLQEFPAVIKTVEYHSLDRSSSQSLVLGVLVALYVKRWLE